MSGAECVGKSYEAVVERVEAYGAYVRFECGTAIVLVIDMPKRFAPDPRKHLTAGQRVRVTIQRYHAPEDAYKATMSRDDGSDALE